MNNNKIHIAFNDLKRIVSSHFIEAYISIMFYHKKMARKAYIKNGFRNAITSHSQIIDYRIWMFIILK